MLLRLIIIQLIHISINIEYIQHIVKYLILPHVTHTIPSSDFNFEKNVYVLTYTTGFISFTVTINKSRIPIQYILRSKLA